MRFFELEDGQLLNIEQIEVISNEKAIEVSDRNAARVEITMSSGRTRHVCVEDARELRTIIIASMVEA